MGKGITLRRPVINGETVTYFDGKKWQKRDMGEIGLYLTKGIHDLAFKDKNKNKGNLTKKDVLSLLQGLFEHTELRSSGGSSGYLSDIKNMFGLYLDKDSAGGENITQQEQYQIMRTLVTWFGE